MVPVRKCQRIITPFSNYMSIRGILQSNKIPDYEPMRDVGEIDYSYLQYSKVIFTLM